MELRETNNFSTKKKRGKIQDLQPLGGLVLRLLKANLPRHLRARGKKGVACCRGWVARACKGRRWMKFVYVCLYIYIWYIYIYIIYIHNSCNLYTLDIYRNLTWIPRLLISKERCSFQTYGVISVYFMLSFRACPVFNGHWWAFLVEIHLKKVGEPIRELLDTHTYIYIYIIYIHRILRKKLPVKQNKSYPWIHQTGEKVNKNGMFWLCFVSFWPVTRRNDCLPFGPRVF